MGGALSQRQVEGKEEGGRGWHEELWEWAEVCKQTVNFKKEKIKSKENLNEEGGI